MNPADVRSLADFFAFHHPGMRAQMFVDSSTFARWWFAASFGTEKVVGRSSRIFRCFVPPSPTPWREATGDVPLVRLVHDVTLPVDSHVKVLGIELVIAPEIMLDRPVFR